MERHFRNDVSVLLLLFGFTAACGVLRLDCTVERPYVNKKSNAVGGIHLYGTQCKNEWKKSRIENDDQPNLVLFDRAILVDDVYAETTSTFSLYFFYHESIKVVKTKYLSLN